MSSHDLKVSIVVSEFNSDISNHLLNGATQQFLKSGGSQSKISVFRVPGAFEIPGTVKQILKNTQPDLIVTLGSVIQGETAHFDFICSEVSRGIANLSMENNIPIVFGILTSYNYEQTLERAHPKKKNKGGEVMQAALEMSKIYKEIQS